MYSNWFPNCYNSNKIKWSMYLFSIKNWPCQLIEHESFYEVFPNWMRITIPRELFNHHSLDFSVGKSRSLSISRFSFPSKSVEDIGQIRAGASWIHHRLAITLWWWVRILACSFYHEISLSQKCTKFYKSCPSWNPNPVRF